MPTKRVPSRFYRHLGLAGRAWGPLALQGLVLKVDLEFRELEAVGAMHCNLYIL